jgi:WbqC-like protein family
MMQPYFFPYLGYFSLVEHVDVFVLFDTAQFIRCGWVGRNRILKPGAEDWQYVCVPLRASPRSTPIRAKLVTTDRHGAGGSSRRRPLPKGSTTYRRGARHLADDHATIADFDRAALRRLCAHLRIQTELLDFSAMQVLGSRRPGTGRVGPCDRPGAAGGGSCRALDHRRDDVQLGRRDPRNVNDIRMLRASAWVGSRRGT